MSVIGPYLIGTIADDCMYYPCTDSRTGERHCVLRMDSKAFATVAHVLSNEFKGVQRTRAVHIMDGKAYLFKSRNYGDLYSHLKYYKRLSEIQAMPLFRQMVETVKDVHSSGIVLRNLRLKKFVFIDVHKTMLNLQSLEDCYQGTDLLTERQCGIAYISPEMLQPGPYSGRAANMWCLGVILFTLLVGCYPILINTRNIITTIQEGRYCIPDFVSPLACSLIASLLCSDPYRRFSAETTLEHPWFKITTESQPCSTNDQIVPSAQTPD